MEWTSEGGVSVSLTTGATTSSSAVAATIGGGVGSTTGGGVGSSVMSDAMLCAMWRLRSAGKAADSLEFQVPSLSRWPPADVRWEP